MNGRRDFQLLLNIEGPLCRCQNRCHETSASDLSQHSSGSVVVFIRIGPTSIVQQHHLSKLLAICRVHLYMADTRSFGIASVEEGALSSRGSINEILRV